MMSSVFSNTFCANSDQPESVNAIYAEQSSGINDSTTEGYYICPILYPLPLFYNVYNTVTSVEDNGTTFYYYQRYAVPLYSVYYDPVTHVNEFTTDVYSDESPADFTTENVEQHAQYSDSYDPVAHVNESTTDVYSSESSAEFPNENGEHNAEYSDSYDPVTHVNECTTDVYSSEYPAEFSKENGEHNAEYSDSYDPVKYVNEPTIDVYSSESPAEFPNENGEQNAEYRKLWLNGSVEDILTSSEGEKNEIDVGSENSEESLDTTNASLVLPYEDISQLIDKCHGDYEKNIENDDAVKESPSDSIREKHSPKESNEDRNDDFLNDSIFDDIEDQEFKVEASYCGPSEDEFLKQSSCVDLDEDNFINSSFYCRKVFKKLRYFKTEIEVLPTIYEEDEPSEEDEELSEGNDEVEHPKNLKKKRFQRIRRWFSQLTSCCRKNREPPG